MKPKAKYQCPICEASHDFECSARECCEPEVAEVWECSECNEIYDDESEALHCCAESEEDLIDPVKDFFINQQNLELQGQQRLF